MTFTYTYRNNSGALETDVIEAANRLQCLAELKKQGVLPIKILEGGVAPKSGSGPSNCDEGLHEVTPAHVRMRWMIVAVTLLAICSAVVAIWYCRRPAPSVKVSVVKPVTNVTPEAGTPVQKQGAPAVKPEPVPAAVPATLVAAPTNRVKRAGFTKQGRRLADGTVESDRKLLFTNGVERALSTLCNPGGMAIPLASALRRFSDEDIKRILNEPMIYNPKDPDDYMERKFAVQQLKDQFNGLLKDGLSVRDAITEIDNEVRRENTFSMMSRVGLADAIRTGDGEVVREFIKRQNEKLVQRGMKPLAVPQQFRLEEKSNQEEKK